MATVGPKTSGHCHFFEDGTASVIPDNLWKKWQRWARKHPAIAVLTTILVFAVVCGTFLFLNEYREKSLALTREKKERIAKEQALFQSEWLQYRSQLELAHRELLNGNDPSGKVLLETCPEQFRDWEYNYLKRLYDDIKPTTLPHSDLVWDIVLNPKDDHYLATGAGNGTLTIWNRNNVRKPKLKRTDAHESDIWTLDWSSDGKWLATGSKDGKIKLWRASSLELPTDIIEYSDNPKAEMPEGEGPQVWSVAFGPNSDFLYAGWNDGQLCKWALKVSDGQLQVDAESLQVYVHDAGIWEIGFDSEGKLLATASGKFRSNAIVKEPGEIRIYNAKDMSQFQKPLHHHKRACTCLAFSPDGQWFVTTGYDRSIVVYRRSMTAGQFEKQYTQTVNFSWLIIQ